MAHSYTHWEAVLFDGGRKAHLGPVEIISLFSLSPRGPDTQRFWGSQWGSLSSSQMGVNTAPENTVIWKNLMGLGRGEGPGTGWH